MWGSTKPNTADECTWANAPFNGGSSHYNETYFNSVKDTVCPNGILAKEYDAAFYATGGKARMPTSDEFQEMYDNTDNEWVEGYNGSGVNGRKFTSKTDGSKYIFIPAADYCLDGSVYNVGSGGYVWGSSLYTSNPYYAWGLYFYSDDCLMYDNRRYSGRSVRGVMD